MTSYTPNLDLAKQDTGAQGWGTVLNQNFDKIDAGFGEIGVKVYSATVSYASGEFVIASVSGVVGLYKSLQGNNVGHILTDTTWWEAVPLSGSADVDEKSITKNSSDKLQTVGVINSRDSSTAIKTWTGTKAQYDAIVTKDANTLYNITDDVTGGSSVYTKSQVDTLLADKLNTSGSNATTATLKNINNAGGGTSIKCIQLLTKTAYDAIVTKDSEILYLTYEV